MKTIIIILLTLYLFILLIKKIAKTPQNEIETCVHYSEPEDYSRAVGSKKETVKRFTSDDAYTDAHELAIMDLKKVEELVTNEEDLMDIYLRLGSLYFVSCDSDNALLYSNKCLDLAKKLGNKRYKLLALEIIADVLNYYKGELDKALSYYKKLLKEVEGKKSRDIQQYSRNLF